MDLALYLWLRLIILNILNFPQWDPITISAEPQKALLNHAIWHNILEKSLDSGTILPEVKHKFCYFQLTGLCNLFNLVPQFFFFFGCCCWVLFLNFMKKIIIHICWVVLQIKIKNTHKVLEQCLSCRKWSIKWVIIWLNILDTLYRYKN